MLEKFLRYAALLCLSAATISFIVWKAPFNVPLPTAHALGILYLTSACGFVVVSILWSTRWIVKNNKGWGLRSVLFVTLLLAIYYAWIVVGFSMGVNQ
jgi:hypothetical protein